MAFNYFTIDSIKQLDASNIPEAFVQYYQNLSDEMKEEIMDIRPDLVEALGLEENGLIDDESEIILEGSETEIIGDEMDEEENEDEDEDYSPVIEAWEEISVRAWRKHEIESSVFVCKVIPDNVLICPVHRVPLVERQIKIRHGRGAIYSILGRLCPECMDFFITQDDIDIVIRKLEDYKIPTWIQPLEDTLAEWGENAAPIELDNNIVIYVPDTWVEGQTNCPVHPDEILIKDKYRKTYKDRFVEFEAFYCSKCNKIIMRNALAQKLEDDCGEIGIPAIEFVPLHRDSKSKKKASKIAIRPDYFIHDGEVDVYDFDISDDEDYWEQINEKDIMVVNYTRSCIEEEHEAEDTLALVGVQEKKKGLIFYLILIGYCRDCEKYYIAKEDFDLLARKGRPIATIIDETGTFSTITSGTMFENEKLHLDGLEKLLDQKIDAIENSSGFVGKYAVGDYDDIDLIWAKRASEPLYEELDRLGQYKSKPYGYRTDLTFDDKTETYYLGVSDIDLDGNNHVISFNSNLGRKLVNYRTLELIKNEVKWKVKRRRTFDIDKAILYGFTEQSDEDVIFRSGITDSFLINVLNKRKKQHQLIDIIATIQENQNAIIDSPFKDNLIVQGCAGSGKTMILLHRLSTLKYNNPGFDFSYAVILTPSKNFNTHINGLASSLQLGHVDRYSIEDYYYMLLRKYDDSFVLKNPISDEMNVDQTYVDFIYSNEFKEIINVVYKEKMEEIRDIFSRVKDISAALERPVLDEVYKTDNSFIKTLLSEIRLNAAKTENDEKEKKNAEEKLYLLRERAEALDKEINEGKKQLESLMDLSFVKASSILSELYTNSNQSFLDLDKQISEREIEYHQIEERRVVVRKRQKLIELQDLISSLRDQQVALKQSTDKLQNLRSIDFAALNQEEQLDFLFEAGNYSSDVSTYLQDIQKQIKTIQDKSVERADLNNQILESEEYIKTVNEKMLSDTLRKHTFDFYEWSSDITPKKIYMDVYQVAAKRANDTLERRNGKRYKNIRGTHRYDLYLQLMFAMRYFGEKKGNNPFVCIDEGQDLAPLEYQLIATINDNPIVNVYGDTNQLMKKRGISDWSLLSNTIGPVKQFVLNENYRNTNQITRFCNDTFHMDVSLTGADGHSVKEMARIKLENSLANLKITEERVAILLPRIVKKDKYLDIEQLPTEIQEKLGTEFGNGKIAIEYVDEVKGVEFDRVYVVPNGMEQNEKYIAFTRALSDLIVVYDDSLDQPIQKSSESYKKDANKPPKSSTKPQIKKNGSITIGKVNVKRNKKEEERREALRNKFEAAVANIVKVKADAIVSSYSKSENAGSLSSSVYRAAGRGIIKELKYKEDLKCGEVCITRGYDLKCKYVIHAFAPKWIPEMANQSEIMLEQTYQNIMKCALEYKIRTLAIPLLSTGYNGFPKRRAAYIALYTVSEFVEKHMEKFDKIAFIVQEDVMIVFEQLLRHIGKGEDVKVTLSNCVKCNKRIRIRKKQYDRYVIDGFIPQYCGTCSKEVYERRTCEICGEFFDISYSEKDFCEQTGKELPVTCNQCRNNLNIQKISTNATVNETVESQHDDYDIAINDQTDDSDKNEQSSIEVYAFGEQEGKYYMIPYEGKLKFITDKKVTNMYIPQKMNGKEKRVPVSVVEEDHIIYITEKNYKAYKETLMKFGGISLYKV